VGRSSGGQAVRGSSGIHQLGREQWYVLRPRENGGGNLLAGRRPLPTAAVKAGANTIPFNTETTHWLGVRLDSELTQGPSRHSAEGQEERNGTAPPARRTDGPLASQLQEGHDSLHPVRCHVRIGAATRPNPGHRGSRGLDSPAGPPAAPGTDSRQAAITASSHYVSTTPDSDTSYAPYVPPSPPGCITLYPNHSAFQQLPPSPS